MQQEADTINQESPTTPAAPSPPGARHLDRGMRAWPWIALAVLLAMGWLLWDMHNKMNEVRVELAVKLAEAATTNKQTEAIAAQSREDVKEALAKLSVLENKLAESQNQQVALEALYQELSRSRDEVSLSELEDTLLTASQQLQLAGNVKAALIALQSVDARLTRVEKPKWTQLRRAVTQDMAKLKALPYVDTIGISARLDSLINGIDALPLLAAPVDVEQYSEVPPQSVAKQEGLLQRLGGELWASLRELVRIRDLGKAEVPLLPPNQEYFLRENLRLRLLSARLALLARDENGYKADLKAAQDWIATYYDLKAKQVVNAQTSLRQLAESRVSIAVPDITDSLNALKTLQAAREKGSTR